MNQFSPTPIAHLLAHYLSVAYRIESSDISECRNPIYRNFRHFEISESDTESSDILKYTKSHASSLTTNYVSTYCNVGYLNGSPGISISHFQYQILKLSMFRYIYRNVPYRTPINRCWTTTVAHLLPRYRCAGYRIDISDISKYRNAIYRKFRYYRNIGVRYRIFSIYRNIEIQFMEYFRYIKYRIPLSKFSIYIQK